MDAPAFIILFIVTLCGDPHSGYFFYPEDGSVISVDLNSQQLKKGALGRIETQPHLELDVTEQLGLRCS